MSNVYKEVSEIMKRSGNYYEVLNDNYLNKQFDCNPRTPYTRYYFDLGPKTGYAQALYSNVKVYQYNPENMDKVIVNNPLNIINNK
jgi:hypothetical protein